MACPLYICPSFMKKAFLQLHLAIFLAGFTAILGKLISVNEAILVWYRLVIAVLILLVILGYQKKIPKLKWKEITRLFGVGFVIAFHWVAFYGSIKYSTVSVGLVCLSASGFFTAMLEPLFYRKRIVVAEILLGLLSIVGISIIFDFHRQYSLGIIFGILSALGSSVFPILNKRLVGKYSPRTVSLYELTGGLLFLTMVLPLYLYFFKASSFLPSLADFGWLFILASLCTVYCFDLQLAALKKISAFTSNLSYNLEPVYGIILSFIFFKEAELLNKGFYIGLLIIGLSVLLQMWREANARTNAGTITGDAKS